MKLNDIISFLDFYNEIKDQKIPFALAYKMSKLVSRTDAEIKFYQTELTKIIDEYSLKDANNNPISKDGKGVQLAPNTQQECQKKLRELEEVEINIDPVFSPEELSIFSLTTVQMLKVLPFIKE